MKLHIWTQDQENYGAHDWDGEGECPQRWKFKGGADFFVPKFKGGEAEATTAVMALRSSIEEHNEYFRREVLGWKLVDNDYLTEFERSQLEYEGKITHKSKELTW
jgi:hypothetical protein